MRRAYAELLRQFVSGRMTNDEFVDRYWQFNELHGADDAVDDIHDLMWHFHDDLVEHRMTDPGRRVQGLNRHCAQWILFLNTNHEYSREDGEFLNSGMLRVALHAFLLFVAFPIALLSKSWLGVAAICIAGVVNYISLWITGASPCPRTVRKALPEEGTSIWPFESLGDYVAARNNPRLLVGAAG